MTKAKILTIVFILLMTLPSGVFASGKSGGRGDKGPPPEAIEACKGKSEGDVVSFKGRRGEDLEAVCSIIDDQLVAVPEGGKGGGRPPQD